MKLKTILGLSSALCLCVTIAQAQETNESASASLQRDEVGQLKQQLRQMQENFEKVENEQHQQIKALTQKLDELTNQQQATAASAPPVAVTTNKLKELSDKVDQVVEAQKKTLMSEFNPAIGLVGDMVFSYRSKSSDATGSDRPGGFDAWMRSLEMVASASVDPFAKGYAVINASADSQTGEATWGIEEAALQTTSLPWNLELKAGRFFGEFGRLAYIHDHELPFVNRPLALDEYIGGESRSDGLQINWLVPTKHYISLTAGLGDSFGGDSPNPDHPGNFRAFDGFNFWGRLSTYFDLTPNWQLEGGVSGLWNPKEQDRGGVILQPDGSGFAERERRLGGIDFKLSYVPLQNNQFRSFVWGTEMLYSDNRYLVNPAGDFDPSSPPPGLSTETVGSLGLYSYMTYKWHRQWSAGFLFDWLQNAQNHDDQTFAYSPYITWAISHWNQLRLQYTHTDHNALSGLHPDDAIYLQWTWIIGAHSHGWQQR
jgi:predicted esterase YcpF (UPF0227 family)